MLRLVERLLWASRAAFHVQPMPSAECAEPAGDDEPGESVKRGARYARRMSWTRIHATYTRMWSPRRSSSATCTKVRTHRQRRAGRWQRESQAAGDSGFVSPTTSRRSPAVALAERTNGLTKPTR